MIMHESGENYLETILTLKQKKGNVRSIDIANELNYTKPSISRAMKLLRESGYITVDNGGYIFLTEEGAKIAHSVYERHLILKDFLISLGVNAEIAEKDACRIEHIISDETFDKLKQFIKKA